MPVDFGGGSRRIYRVGQGKETGNDQAAIGDAIGRRVIILTDVAAEQGFIVSPTEESWDALR